MAETNIFSISSFNKCMYQCMFQCSSQVKMHDVILRAWPHLGVPVQNRCGNRPQGKSGTHIRWVHARQPLGVSKAAGTMFLPENGTNHQNMVIFYRCSQATLEVSLDEFFYVPEGCGVTLRFCFAIGQSCGEVSD